MPLSDVTCPHCGRNWFAEASGALEVTCAGCGSSVQMVTVKTPATLPSTNRPTKQRKRTFAARETTRRGPKAWKVGDTILDLYDVTALLGRGGMGEVFRVRHRGWGIDLAVKTPLPAVLDDDEGRDAFVREAETWAELGVHPHVVTCHYVRTIGGIPRIFAEFVEGGSLLEWIRGRKFVDVAQKLDVAIQFAWGLQRAHEIGVIHQDVKPANVMMTPDGVAKVTDFGLSKAKGKIAVAPGVAGDTAMVSVSGFTPTYCSPEQWERRPLTRRTDLWSWAVSVLEMFAGQTLWSNGVEAPLSMGKVELPPGLRPFLAACFSIDPEKRPATMRDAAEAVRAIHGSFSRAEPKTSRALADGLNNRALSMLDLGREAESAALFDQALAADPRHGVAIYNRGLLDWRAGRLTDDALLRRLREQPELVAHVEAERGAVVEGKKVEGHRGAITSVAVARGLTVTGGRDRTVRLWPSGASLEGHTDGVNAVAVTPDGWLVVSAGVDKTLRAWNVSTRKCLKVFEGHAGPASGVAVSADGKRAISSSWDGTLKLWEVASGRCVKTLKEHTEGVNALAATPDFLLAVSAGSDGTMRVWNLEQGRCIATLTGHKGGVLAAAVSPDGRTALTGGIDQLVRAWDLSTMRCDHVCAGHGDRVLAVATDGTSVGSGGRDRTVRVWEAERCRRTIETADAVLAVALDGRILAAGDGLRAFERAQPSRSPLVIVRPRRSEQISADEQRVSQTLDKARVAIGRKNWRQAATLLAQARAVAGYERAPEALELWAEVSRSTGRGVLRDVWQRSVRPAGAEKKSAENWNGTLAASPAGRQVTVTETATGACLRKHEGAVVCLAMSWDGRTVFGGAADGLVRAWTAERETKFAEGHKGAVLAIAVSANGRQVLTGGADGKLRLWNAESGRVTRAIDAHARPVTGVAMSADGTFAVSVSEDGALKLWMADGRCLRVLEGHAGEVLDVTMSPDLRTVTTVGRDRTVREWHLDWNLSALDPAMWHEGARPWLEAALACAMPREQLMKRLEWGGYGWLRPEGVALKLSELEKTTSRPEA